MEYWIVKFWYEQKLHYAIVTKDLKSKFSLIPYEVLAHFKNEKELHEFLEQMKFYQKAFYKVGQSNV